MSFSCIRLFLSMFVFYFFFFQAEDGIRDGHVTGVQTCALPISFWPVTPKYSSDENAANNSHKLWHKVASLVEGSPRKVWAGTLVLLFIGAAWLPLLNATGVSNSDILLSDTDAKAGQEVLHEHFI